mgnify:CR=1 FL=1
MIAGGDVAIGEHPADRKVIRHVHAQRIRIDHAISHMKPMDLADGEQRLGLKLIHLNKCPVLAPAKTLTEERATEFGIDRAQCLKHLDFLRQHRATQANAIELYQQLNEYPAETNPDYQLYNGFISDADKQKMAQLHQLTPEQLAADAPQFSDERLNSLLFLYRARNYPQTLTHAEMSKWQRYCHDKLTLGVDNPARTVEDFTLALENAAESVQTDERKMKVLQALFQFVSAG